LPAIAAATIIDGKINSNATVATRRATTDSWATVDDTFLIASCAKAFTATLIVILIEKDYLEWHTTLRDAYPDIQMRPVYEDITVLPLLSHRAGLAEWTEDLSSWWTDRDPPPNMGSPYPKETVKQKLADTPGASVYYSNSGFIIAGAML
jgi:D-alanyl-D-alanine carboxypeptidase